MLGRHAAPPSRTKGLNHEGGIAAYVGVVTENECRTLVSLGLQDRSRQPDATGSTLSIAGAYREYTDSQDAGYDRTAPAFVGKRSMTDVASRYM